MDGTRRPGSALVLSFSWDWDNCAGNIQRREHIRTPVASQKDMLLRLSRQPGRGRLKVLILGVRASNRKREPQGRRSQYREGTTEKGRPARLWLPPSQ